MKKKILLVYQSKTGFTQKYAELAAGKTGCALLCLREATWKKLSEYETVVFGSRAWAGRIDGYSKLKKLLQKVGVRRHALFVTGATPLEAQETVESFWRQNLTEDELTSLPHFYLPSGLCYEKMGFADRFLMKMAASMMKKKSGKTPEEQAFESAISSSYDISSEKYLEPLVEWINGEQAEEKSSVSSGRQKDGMPGISDGKENAL